MSSVIKVEGLSKEYIIGAREKGGTTFAEMLGSSLTAPLRRLSKLSGHAAPEEKFWALEDVSFEVFEGEVVGIIGRNGAGKSTLLKILSRITSPTRGKVEICGRVASLLEVGTGFHPELTGRENVYLNGAVLGMTRGEITRKFDEIVAFAGVEKFLDTPVKRYSSGMHVRLAFAVAAHLELENLIVDEVLAVGDIEFQKKCLGKMEEAAGGGRTVLFVSHNLAAVSSLCSKGLLLANGRVAARGTIEEVISAYTAEADMRTIFHASEKASGKVRLAEVRLAQLPNAQASSVVFEVTLVAIERVEVSVDLRLKDKEYVPVGFGSLGASREIRPIHLEPGENRFLLEMSTDRLASGTYFVSIDITNPFIEFYDRAEDCIRILIDQSSSVCGSSAQNRLKQDWGYGCVAIPLHLKQPTYASY